MVPTTSSDRSFTVCYIVEDLLCIYPVLQNYCKKRIVITLVVMLFGHLSIQSGLQLYHPGHCNTKRVSECWKTTYFVTQLICEVIWENWAYGGANSAFLEKPFLYVYIQRCLLNCAESEKSVFCRCSNVTKWVCSDQTPRKTGSDQSLLILSLHTLGLPGLCYT